MKKVFKGWCSKQDIIIDKIFYLDQFGEEYTTAIFKTRSDKQTWGEFHWPPKRVTVTVEVED
jgi:hypothetical protein